MKDQLRDAVLNAFKMLMQEDAYLFECHSENEPNYHERKLHEVCINHKLANYLQANIIPIIPYKEMMFVDIEFNREGEGHKDVKFNGREERVRPDIIIHNRKTGDKKKNFLVVECKKGDARQKDVENDLRKIQALMNDHRYEYSFGLHVIYGNNGIQAVLFFKDGENIQSENLNFS